MRLLELSCDQSQFHTLSFNREGLSLIVGDTSTVSSEDGSSNGVGKTLALGLIHHCLGAKVDPRLKKAVPDWLFSLRFEMHGDEYTISRSGSGAKCFINTKAVTQKGLLDWLNNSGIFYLDEGIGSLSFRSLVKRFARLRREDCMYPLATAKETEFHAQLRSLYLLGLDCSLALSKRNLKMELDSFAQAQKNWRNDEVLKDLFRAGAQPRVRLEFLERELIRLKQNQESFEVAEDYRHIELQAGEMTSALRELEKSISIAEFQKRNIGKSLAEHPDISKDDLIELYNGLGDIFRPEILVHFSAVEDFHKSLAANRSARFQRDLIRLNADIARMEHARKELAEKRDEKLQSLQGKRALDEYAAVVQLVATLTEEKERLQKFLNFSADLREKSQLVREKKLEEDRATAEYLLTNPVEEINSVFSRLSQVLYPHLPAGIVIESNIGDNQIRYDLTVQIEGDDSDGINDARILIFDWIVLMYGSNHTMDTLWHDNRLFADIDPNVRAAWFMHVLHMILPAKKQYIATINTENLESMSEFLSEEEMAQVKDSVIVTLRGDNIQNKLMGIQFGK